MKILNAAVLALGLMITPALALDQFFALQSGQWSIEGYRGDKEFCSAKTFWNDGSYVSLFNMKNSDRLSMWVHNESWNMTGDFGSYYDGRIEFSGSAGYDSGNMQFELKDPQTIIIRDVNQSFLENWIKYRTMRIVMPNGIEDLDIGLHGTADSTDAFIECIDILNSY